MLYNGTVLLQVLQDSFTTFDKGWTLPNGLEAEKFPWMKKLEDHWFLYIRNVSLGPLGWGCLQAVLEPRFVFFWNDGRFSSSWRDILTWHSMFCRGNLWLIEMQSPHSVLHRIGKENTHCSFTDRLYMIHWPTNNCLDLWSVGWVFNPHFASSQLQL